MTNVTGEKSFHTLPAGTNAFIFSWSHGGPACPPTQRPPFILAPFRRGLFLSAPNKNPSQQKTPPGGPSGGFGSASGGWSSPPGQSNNKNAGILFPELLGGGLLLSAVSHPKSLWVLWDAGGPGSARYRGLSDSTLGDGSLN